MTDIKDRFLNYVSFPTTSSETSGTAPSSPEQLVLAKHLTDELLSVGLADARMDGFGYVYATLPASAGCEDQPSLGLIAHMDTSPAVSGTDICPRIVRYEGGDIQLNPTTAITEEEFPTLAGYKGQDLIVTDGTTLLGADDKAGVAEIVTTCEYLLAHPEIPHRKLAICFTPDEEIGCGTDHFDFSQFDAKVAYTVDGGELGEIEYENFNAASATIEVRGVNIHPGSAKNKMKNATLMAAHLISLLPAAETPAHTEGYEGFYHVCDLAGNESLVTIHIIIRDHNMEKFIDRKDFMVKTVDYLNLVYGRDTFVLTLKDSYYNMKEKLLPHMDLIHRAEDAMRSAGAEPKIVAIRGGTDGARLSFEGLPCPNLSTGGLNFHGVHEFISVQSMEKMVAVLTYLAGTK